MEEPAAWQTLDGGRAITKFELASIEATDKARGEPIRLTYPTPLYTAPNGLQDTMDLLERMVGEFETSEDEECDCSACAVIREARTVLTAHKAASEAIGRA